VSASAERLAGLEARLGAAEARLAALEAARPSPGWGVPPVCPACGVVRFVAGGCPRWDCPCGPPSGTAVTLTPVSAKGAGDG
jgi:hypothetical protein